MIKKQSQSDTYLVERLQSGDKSTLPLLVKKWHQLFCEKSFFLVRDKDVAKDIVQESWIVIINKINSLKNPERFKFWAYRIVINKSMDYLRLKSKTQKIDYGIDIKAEVDDNSEKEKLKLVLLSAIKNLPNQQKVVVQLFYTQNYSLKQISKILDVSEGTVKSRLFHAREKLKTILKSKIYEN